MPQSRVLDHYQQRLHAAISRSPLLKVAVSKTGRLLDCTRLDGVADGLSRRILAAVVEGRAPIAVDLRLRGARDDADAPAAGAGGAGIAAAGQAAAPAPPAVLFPPPASSGPEVAPAASVTAGVPVPPAPARGRFGRPGRAAETETDPVVREHRLLYEMLDKRMRRHAELAKRETGVHALWLGYPLLHAASGGDDADASILAPVLLWPIRISPDLRRDGRILIGRDLEAGPPRFNWAMAAWVRRMLTLELPVPSEEEMEEVPWQEVKDDLARIAAAFRTPPVIDCDAPLESIPGAASLDPKRAPRYLNAAVLGYFRWQHEAILADLEAIEERTDAGGGVVPAFLTGAAPPAPAAAATPPEEDRYLVCDSDFSQERVVWQSRQGPGLVVHGPPGTGKSQTIVNIIADALAHGRTVLMVCQKQAATRVVLERLRGAGLAGLCLEVHDPDGDRLAAFKAIREQVERPPDAIPTADLRRRDALGARVRVLEEELDRHARALHEPHARVGLSYREMLAAEGRLYREFPSARAVPTLQEAAAALTAAELEAMLPKIETVGRWFREADAAVNPWRDRRPSVQMSVALRADVTAAAQAVRAADEIHREQVGRAGAGIAVPSDVEAFATDAPEAVRRLRASAGAGSADPRVALARAWLAALRGRSDADAQAHGARCREAVELARRAEAAPPDPKWDAAWVSLGPLGREQLAAQAAKVLASRGRWWRALDPFFHAAARGVRAVARDAAGDRLWDAADALRREGEARDLRDRLAAACASVVPGLPAKAGDAAAALRFPSLALEAFDTVDALRKLEPRHAWLTPLLDALADAGGAARLPGLIDDVERSVARITSLRELLKSLSGLEAFLLPATLQEPAAAARAGRSVGPWLDRLAAGLEKLETLAALDLDRSQRQGALKAALDALERIESRRAAGEALPAPPDGLAVAAYGRWWSALVRCAALQAWQAECRREQPVLVEMKPEVHAAKVAQLADLLREKRSLETTALGAFWELRRQAVRDRPWNRLFQLRGSKLGKSMRLREAVALALPEGLLSLRPCWLVDPAAAAQIFPLQPGLFDLVIFDEASQCPVEQALPAILRGKALVVAGDEKQLPPTSFFAARLEPGAGGDDEEEDEDAEATDQIVAQAAPAVGGTSLLRPLGYGGQAGADSRNAGSVPAVSAGPAAAGGAPSTVRRDRRLQALGEEALLQAGDLLEASIACGLREEYLCVHYRSEHPALIQYSDRAFYDDRLEYPPSRLGAAAAVRPIRYHAVDGRYDGRTNRDEARKVVELLRDVWLAKGTAPTVGVVTFNQPQQELIEDLIQEECRRDAAFAERFAAEAARKESNQDVGFFVKNLESVQGDERDVMMFSTTFGPDPQGKFYRRFGPVGAVGGERRLNVAVTRAKRGVIVVGSMPVERVAAALGGEAGAPLTPAGFLQLYLAYARAVADGRDAQLGGVLDRLGRRNDAVPEPAGAGSALAEDVKTALETMGCAVEPGVGESGFRIDLVVLHRDPARGYALGVECDGAAYHAGRPSRLRDVWRDALLRRRGWTLHRVWSARWWTYRDEEVAKLKEAVEKAMSGG